MVKVMINDKTTLILVDLGYVLYKSNFSEIKNKLLEKSSLYKEEFYKKLALLFDKSFYGKINTEEIKEEYKKLADLANDKEVKSILENIFLQRNERLISYLTSISPLVKIGILSDLDEFDFGNFKNNFGDFLKIISEDYIFLSYITHQTKRDNCLDYLKSIFDRCNMKFNNIILIDDSKKTINIANEIGFIGIVYNFKDDLSVIHNAISLIINR